MRATERALRARSSFGLVASFALASASDRSARTSGVLKRSTCERSFTGTGSWPEIPAQQLSANKRSATDWLSINLDIEAGTRERKAKNSNKRRPCARAPGRPHLQPERPDST